MRHKKQISDAQTRFLATWRLSLAFLAAVALYACRAQAQTSDPVIIGAGDIGGCAAIANSEATAKLLDTTPGTVITLGDNANTDGTTQQFLDCYGPTWGRQKARTRPATGNHDYHTSGAKPYFDYFGASAGDLYKGYYSYDLGTWHIIVLNSECAEIHGCQEGSAQETWLLGDLKTHQSSCTLAYWHRPLFSSAFPVQGDRSFEKFWRDLYAAGADIVLNGHDHHYERFAPQDPDGHPDPTKGIREFVVGTGGQSHDQFGPPIPNSEVRDATTFGVLRLTLHAKSYDWQFIPIAGKTFRDQGSATCH